MATQWYYQIMGETVGPLAARDVKAHAQEGRITHDTLVRKGDDGQWMLADRVQGIFMVQSPAAAMYRPGPLNQQAEPHACLPSLALSSMTTVVLPRELAVDATHPPPAFAKLHVGQVQPCPYCGEQIIAVAKKCRFCGEWVDKTARIKRFSVPIKVVPAWNIPFFLLFTLELYWLFWLFRVFKELHARGFTAISPGTAVGCCFIPFYNLYWLFAVFSELKNAIERAYDAHHQPRPATGCIWTMPVVWWPASILTAATGGAGIPFTMTAASVTLCSVQSWMNHLAAVEQA